MGSQTNRQGTRGVPLRAHVPFNMWCILLCAKKKKKTCYCAGAEEEEEKKQKQKNCSQPSVDFLPFSSLLFSSLLFVLSPILCFLPSSMRLSSVPPSHFHFTWPSLLCIIFQKWLWIISISSMPHKKKVLIGGQIPVRMLVKTVEWVLSLKANPSTSILIVQQRYPFKYKNTRLSKQAIKLSAYAVALLVRHDREGGDVLH